MRVTKGRPYVTLKLAVSADGKAGLGRRASRRRSPAKRRWTRVFQMRAASDAIMIGIGTVLSDNPQLSCRLPGMFERSPVRVVLDASCEIAVGDLGGGDGARDADLGLHLAHALGDR